MVRLLFVCLGNICRSPAAEGVMQRLIAARGWDGSVEIDSAGTGDWHTGESADRRCRDAARRRGIDIVHRARQVTRGDYSRFDYLIAMDQSNLAVLERRAPADHSARIVLFRSFDADAPEGAEVPDPYYGGDDGFDEVLDICERACEGLARHLQQEHGLGR
jgi:protein-tyrosine phosphatase